MSDKREGSSILDSFQERRTVALGDRINEEKIHDLNRRLMRLQFESNDPITMLINSNGGQSDQALQLCDLMRYVLKAPVHGMVVGRCCSAATFILLHCARRAATPYSRFIIHTGKSELTLELDYELEHSIEHLLLEGQRLRARSERIYKEKLKLSISEVRRMLKRGNQDFNENMDAHEALKIGLIDEIVTEKLDIF